VRIIRRFFTDLPTAVDIETRQACEGHLARIASEHTPDALRNAADRLMAWVAPRRGLQRCRPDPAPRTDHR
jgi:Domain of unknown function (DUF222)